MFMTSELPFPGFNELIHAPLSNSDQRSFSLIKRIFIETKADSSQPFTILIQKLSGKILANGEAITCWKQILKHKIFMQQKLGRIVGIQTATIDYFEYQSPVEILFHLPAHQEKNVPSPHVETVESLHAQSGGYYLEKLKDEILRAKRYKHALSVILIDIDNFDKISNTLSSENCKKVLSVIVGIIKKIIRTVDILSRLTSDRFLLILPNTNAREAKELAERIRIQILERTSRLSMLSEGITATIAVGQCTHQDSSIDFINRLERLLDEGKYHTQNTVFSLC
jgi:diguanylate cyclase (GGDEF)-like protein